MKILICSHCFHPSVGGIETVSRILAEQFSTAGAVVTVVTDTLGAEAYSYKVIRRPSIRMLRSLGRQSDVIFQSNISLKTLLPLLFLGKPIVITHHTWLRRMDGRLAWQDRLKRFLLHFCHNVAISKSIGESLSVASVVIGNPFEKTEFAPFHDTHKAKDIVFVGRLVSDKGCDLALQALALLKSKGITLTLTVIGDGPERQSLEELTRKLGISNQVCFKGSLTEGRGKEVAEHRVLVVPSRWSEPFGLVALEGLAAGCAVVASSNGGLPEAVGPCGILFPNGDVGALADALQRICTDVDYRRQLTNSSQEHLERFDPKSVADEYLKYFHHVMGHP